MPDTTTTFVHVSQLLGSPLVDRSGERLGRVEDVIVRLADGGFPPVTGLKGRIGGRELFVPADHIASLTSSSAQLSAEKLDLRRFDRRPGEVLLGDDILGRKLIFVEGARLVTAHQIELACVDGWWRVVAINPSRRARLARLLGRSPRTPSGESLISWNDLEPFVGHVPTSRLRIRHRKLAQLHPAQIADLVEAASHEEGEEIIQAVGQDRELEADVFEELDDEHQVEFIRERSDEEAAKLIARMAPDDAADLITELDQERRESILALLPPRQQRRVRQLLGYNPSTAGGLMNPDFIALPKTATVGEALRRVRTSDIPPEAANTVFVLDEAGEVEGSLPTVALIRAPEDTLLSELSHGETPKVQTDADLPEVANLMTDYNLVALPVVDENERMVGVVTVDDLLELMLPTGWRWRHRVTSGS